MRVTIDESAGKATFDLGPEGQPYWRHRERLKMKADVEEVVATVLRRLDRITEHASRKIAERVVGRARARSFSSDLTVERRFVLYVAGECEGCGLASEDSFEPSRPGECPRPSVRSKKGLHVWGEVRRIRTETLAEYRAAK